MTRAHGRTYQGWLALLALALCMSACGKPAPTKPQASDKDKGAATQPGKELPHPSQAAPDLRLVPADALGFVSVRVADLWNSDPVKQVRSQLPPDMLQPVKEFEKNVGLSPADVERITVVLLAPPNEIETPLVMVVTAKPYDAAKLRSVIAPDAKEQKEGDLAYYSLKGEKGVAHFASDRLFMFGPLKDVQRVTKLRDTPPKLTGYLNGALTRAAQPHILVAAIDPTPLLRMAPTDQMPEDFRPLLDMKFATVVIDLGKDLETSLQLHFADNDQAGKAEKSVTQGLAMAKGLVANAPGIGDDESLKAVHKKMVASMNTIAVKQEGPSVEISWKEGGISTTMTALLVPAMAKVREAANRTQSTNNLKQIALAMHNYHDVNKGLPPAAIYSKDGTKPLLSWRVAILPYIEQQSLYQQFKLDEPWDSPANKKLLAQMPQTYATPGVTTKEPFTTFYRSFVGKGTMFEGPNGIRFTDVTDGMSNTLMVVEASDAVPWTKPDELTYDAKQKLPPLGKISPAVFLAALGDGSVRAISKKVKEPTLRALITRNGNEVINDPDY